MNLLTLLLYSIPSSWAIRRDNRKRSGITPWLWIPTIWIGIIMSKPLTSWLSIGGDGGTSMEGSSVDAIFYFTLMAIAFVVLIKRRLDWGDTLRRNWPLFLLYGFFLVSVLWANSSYVSFKRWFKECGNILIILLILTEPDPRQALRAIFTRCAFQFFALSVIYIRYFPSLGRRYSRSGGLEITGVTTQKNTLGAMVAICGVFLLWDWIEKARDKRFSSWRDRLITPGLLSLGIYLLYQCNSQTSMLCLVVGAFIVFSSKVPFLRKRIGAFGIYALLAAGVFWVLDSEFGISQELVGAMGRDMSFTGRTDVWRELLSVGTNPIFGTGFMSLWDDPFYRNQLPYWVAGSAHNGYIEIYLMGGWVAISLLAFVLVWAAVRINASLRSGDNFSLIRFAILMMALIMNFSESNFLCMTPMGLLLWLAGIGHARAYNVSRPAETRRPTSGRHAGIRPATSGMRSPRYRTS
ncbi:MAG: O-antigen ligase family protein [Opitutaceae bacterium]|nr:O-antigen ligase family protein [Opitutaceae bacterium]